MMARQGVAGWDVRDDEVWWCGDENSKVRELMV